MDAAARTDLVAAIHAGPYSGVLAVTGGGALLLADLLTVPGASATVLEARVPYAAAALAQYLGAAPEQACSASAARDLAMASWQRALALAPTATGQRFGLGCTASLATIDTKRGEHRVHVALQTSTRTQSWSVTLAKSTRDRATEERLAADFALLALAETVGLQANIELPFAAGEVVTTQRASVPLAWGEVLCGRRHYVAINDPAPPTVLFPGAFNPLHDGHRAMAHYAQHVTGQPVAFEICANNVDKPRLNFIAIEQRLAQFGSDVSVWLTDTPTFVDKAHCFPGVVFVVGIDTLIRIADPKYYGGDITHLTAAIDEIAALGCSFLVFGRHIDGAFMTLGDITIPAALRALCNAVSEAAFRADVSSTKLRNAVQSISGNPQST